MYNWYSLLRPLGYRKDVFKVCLVDDKGEKKTISNCKFTIENVHYPLLLALNNQEQEIEQEIMPVKSIQIWAANKCIEVLDLDNTQEGVAHFLVTNLDQLANHQIDKIIFIPENRHNLELTRK
jgi:hypothetical protein